VNPVSSGGRPDFCYSQIDREDDHHGEKVEIEVKSEEESSEEKGRSGAQEEENRKVFRKEGAEEGREEEGREEGSAETQGAGEEAGPGEEAGAAAGPHGRTRARSVLDTAQFRLRRHRQHLRLLQGLSNKRPRHRRGR
jgi:hypothetical protein